MLKKTFGVFLAVGVLFSGCATQSGYQPTVDPYGDPNADRITIDQIECRDLAKRASGDTVNEAGKGAIVGGLLGAAAGAAIGAAVGSPGRGAAIGAAAGGLGGGAKEGLGAEEAFKRAYQNCMRNRGHNVID
ncbi:MAG: glycine zipper family protein [Nitrospinaceae bacterium]